MMRDVSEQPAMYDDVFITDGGLGTFMILKEGWDLPGSSSFVLLESQEGRNALVGYYERFLSIAREYRTGFVLEAPTWRANTAWLDRLGYSKESLEKINHNATSMLRSIRDSETNGTKILISGCIGPRGDGYLVDRKMTTEQAEEFHTTHVSTFREIAIDMVSALTITYVEKAVGIVRAARSEEIPVVISLTVKTDGRLPTGETLKEAIEEIDESTGNAASYFMINCCHPTHIQHALGESEPWMERIRGIRANASALSHEELDEVEELEEGDPVELAGQYLDLRGTLNNLQVLGGCCGTDRRHVEAICKACLS